MQPARVINGAAVNGYKLITIEDLRRDPEVVAFLQAANATMKALGYTEHGQRHAGLVGNIAENVLEHLGYDPRIPQLANVAGYLHDIGNAIHRQNHALSGSLMAWGDSQTHGICRRRNAHSS